MTFRLAGTLPAEVAGRLRGERDALLRADDGGDTMTVQERRCLRLLAGALGDDYLDQGHAECWLREPAVAQLVLGAMRHFDGDRYTLHAAVVMPNHCHALFIPLGEHRLSDILHSWKSYTAKLANRMLGRENCEFWQRESYDHLVRDDEEFAHFREYISQNPVKAGLCRTPDDWPYLHRSAGVSPAIFVPRQRPHREG